MDTGQGNGGGGGGVMKTIKLPFLNHGVRRLKHWEHRIISSYILLFHKRKKLHVLAM